MSGQRRRDLQHLVRRGYALCDLQRSGNAQRLHPIHDTLLAQREQVGFRTDQFGKGVRDRHQFVNASAAAIAALAAGGAIAAAQIALGGESAFALIRPPSHHASANRAWGMCCFNNMAVALKKIRPAARKALIIDIDLHFGDGTVSIFRGDPDIKIVNPWSVDESYEYLNMDEIGRLLARHQSGEIDATDRIWRLINLQVWGESVLGGRDMSDGLLHSTQKACIAS